MTFVLEVARLGRDVDVRDASPAAGTVALSEVRLVEAALSDGS
jgi:hypothetical protein